MHDAFGIPDDTHEQADRLAAAGYLALVPNLYAGKAAARCAALPLAGQLDGALRHVANEAGVPADVKEDSQNGHGFISP